MGWSCAADAATVTDAWTAACRKSTGQSNAFVGEDGASYFFEDDGVEHEDGAITGHVYKMSGSHTAAGSTCRLVNRFRVEADGTVTKTCAFLGKVAMNIAEARAALAGARSGGDGWKRYVGRLVAS